MVRIQFWGDICILIFISFDTWGQIGKKYPGDHIWPSWVKYDAYLSFQQVYPEVYSCWYFRPGAMAYVLLIWSFPISNTDSEDVLSQVTVAKTEPRSKMNLSLLVAILRTRFGLRLQGKILSTFNVTSYLLQEMNIHYSGYGNTYSQWLKAHTPRALFLCFS